LSAHFDRPGRSEYFDAATNDLDQQLDFIEEKIRSRRRDFVRKKSIFIAGGFETLLHQARREMAIHREGNEFHRAD